MNILESIKKEKSTYEGLIIGCMVADAESICDCVVDESKWSDDGIFYYRIFSKLYEMGYKKFDKISIFKVLESHKTLLDDYEKKGGFRTLKSLSELANTDNLDGYIDSFNKYCLLEELHDKGFDIKKPYKAFENMSASQVYDYYDYQLNNITVEVGTDVKFESFEVTDEDIQDLLEGEYMGIPYNSISPRLSHATLGIPTENLTLLASYINGGKSSFASELAFNFAKQTDEDGNRVKVGIISNEMNVKSYKMLLIIHVLVNDLKYYKVTRKSLKSGNLTKKDLEKIRLAQEIIKRDYSPYLMFAETFNYDIQQAKKIIKSWSKRGVSVVFYDTLKADITDDSTWRLLIEATRVLYQLASQEDLAIIGVMQLALATKHRRILDLDVLANGKQASEPASECIFFRDIHHDEYDGEPNEIYCYNMVKNAEGKYTNIEKQVILEEGKKYKIFFLTKTRNDEAGLCIVYEFLGHLNTWKEIGFARVKHDSERRF